MNDSDDRPGSGPADGGGGKKNLLADLVERSRRQSGFPSLFGARPRSGTAADDPEARSRREGGRRNMMAEVVERRKDEGDFHRLFIAGSRQGSVMGPLSWGIRLVALVLAGVLFFGLLRMFQRAAGDPEVPAAGGGQRASAESTAALDDGSGFPALVRHGVRFRPPLPDFTPIKELDGTLLGEVWDHTEGLRRQPHIGNNIKEEFRVVDHIYQYLRNCTPEELAARADPGLRYRGLMVDPEFEYHRGKAISMNAVVLRVFEIFSWEEQDGKRNASGVLDTTMLFVRNATAGQNADIFVVLVPEPPWNFREKDLYRFTGVFMKRYPYKRRDNKWETHPLLLAMTLTPTTVDRQKSMTLTAVIVSIAAVLMIVLYFTVRGETRESEEQRRERVERRRAVRERHKSRPGVPPPPSPEGGSGGSGGAPPPVAGGGDAPPAAPGSGPAPAPGPGPEAGSGTAP